MATLRDARTEFGAAPEDRAALVASIRQLEELFLIWRILTAPVELLRDVHLVDTPGTNAIIREHERLTTDFVPRSDLVLFVTSADRPFTETDRILLATIRDWGKKIIIVLNKIDI